MMLKHFAVTAMAALALSACSKEPAEAPADVGAGNSYTGNAAEGPTQAQAVAAALSGEAASRYHSHKLAAAPFGPVLVSEYKFADGDFGHVTPGRLDAFYLAPVGTGWKVAQSFEKAVEAGSSGSMADWSISSDYLDNPVIVASGGFTGQGYTVGCTVLTELRPDGPAEVAAVPHFAGMMDEPGTEGAIGSIAKGKSFVVTYTGEKNGTVTWTWQGGKFVPSGPAPIESCGDE